MTPALRTEGRKADAATIPAGDRELVKCRPESFQPCLVGANDDLVAPRREFIFDGGAPERGAQSLVRPGKVNRDAVRAFVEASLDERQALVKPEPRSTTARDKKWDLLRAWRKGETVCLPDDGFGVVQAPPNIRSTSDTSPGARLASTTPGEVAEWLKALAC